MQTLARFRLRFVNSFRDPDRKNGTVRHYFRKPGMKAIPLPGLPGSEEFMAAYAAALAGMSAAAKSEIGESRTLPGTIDALVVSFYKTNNKWLNVFKEETRRAWRPHIEHFRVRHGSKRVRTLRRDHIATMLAEIDKPHTKLAWLKAIRALLRHAVPTMLQDDPTVGIKVDVPRTKGWHSWTDEEVAAYRAYWRRGSDQRLVFEFAYETASRRGEVVRLGAQHVRDGRIRIARTHGSDDVDIPVTPELRAAIEAMPRSGHLTYLVRANGRPWSKSALGRDFAQWAREAGLPDRCRLHGLKKAQLRRRAEKGNTVHELRGLSGHKSLAMLQHYTAAADLKRLADSGDAKMRDETANAPVTNAADQLYKQADKSLK
jgi:site-specific recombinase XerD